MMRKLRVYIAGPYTKPDPCVNTFNAVQAGQKLLEAGHYPFVPHLTHFWHTMAPNPYEKWLELDMEWLKVSDCVLRLSGESSGADAEVAEAEALGIPVFHNINQVLAFSVNSYEPNNTTVILKKRIAELEEQVRTMESMMLIDDEVLEGKSDE